MNQEVTGGRELKQIARFFEHSIPKYIFLVIDDERLARMLIDRIRSELKARAREIGYLKLAGQDTAVFRRVERFLAGNRCDGLIVSGLNGPVYRDPVTTLSQLNKARDAFERFSLPMAFIVNRDTLKKIIQSASDFYQLRDLPDFHFAGTVEEERMMIDIPASMIDTTPDAGLKAGLLEGQLRLREKEGEIDDGVLNSLVIPLLTIYTDQDDMRKAGEIYDKYVRGREDRIKDIAGLGAFHLKAFHLDDALHYYRAGLDLAEKTGDIKGVAQSRHQVGNIYFLRGDYDVALEQYRKSLDIREKIGDIAGVAKSLHQVGIIYHMKGDYDAALEQYRKSLEIKEKIGDIKGVALSLWGIGNVYLDKGDYDNALEEYQKALKTFEKIGDIKNVAGCLHQVGMIYQERGEYDAALGQYQKSLAIFERIGSPNAKIVMGNIALIREKIGEAAFQELLASNLKELGHESVDSASGAS